MSFRVRGYQIALGAATTACHSTGSLSLPRVRADVASGFAVVSGDHNDYRSAT
jgi:hypothetical protein